MRQTDRLRQIAAVLLAAPRSRHYGYQTCKATGLRSGVVYPTLHRLLAAGWLEDGWEEPARGRPPRRFYKLTTVGRRELRRVVSAEAAEVLDR